MASLKKLAGVVDRFARTADGELGARWSSWPKDLSRSEVHEAIGGLLARQVTLAKQLVQRPTTWNGT